MNEKEIVTRLIKTWNNPSTRNPLWLNAQKRRILAEWPELYFYLTRHLNILEQDRNRDVYDVCALIAYQKAVALADIYPEAKDAFGWDSKHTETILRIALNLEYLELRNNVLTNRIQTR